MFRKFFLWGLVAYAGFCTYLIFFRAPKPSPVAPSPKILQSSPAAQALPAPAKTAVKHVAIVIDDIGWMKGEKLQEFLKLGIPLTFAILPGEPFSQKNADEVHAAGQEVILHLPLEPENSERNKPGPYAILDTMSREEISRTFRQDVASVPHAVGVNNHMGSRFISDRIGMKTLMKELKARGLFFMDSRTSPKSVAKRVAHEERVPYLENQVFLDNVDEEQAIIKQLERLISIADKTGSGVAIGHIQRGHIIGALVKMIPKFKQKNIEFVALSKMLKTTKKS